MPDLKTLLEASASRHRHLCPRQVLGVRAALLGASALQLEVPRRDKRLLVIVETDGCFADGVEVVTGASVGHRTMRVEDYGKVAATFVDVRSEQALRVAPCVEARQLAWQYAPGERRHYFAQLHAYQVMPLEQLFSVRPVRLLSPIEAIVSQSGVRSDCQACGEEIINDRQVVLEGRTLCRACAGLGYYVEGECLLQASDLPTPL